jgi:hypothetical protein
MKPVIALVFVLTSFSLWSADYQPEVDKFFSLYQAEKIDEAVNSIYSSNQYVSAIPDQVKQVKTQLSALKGLVGELSHIDKIDTYSVGDNFVHLTYLVSYERQPIRFEFQFFKVKEGWRIYSMSFDDDLTDEIKILAREAALKAAN